MREDSAIPYPLGSHRRWVETLLLLLSPFLIAYIYLCVILHSLGINWIFDFSIAVVLLVSPCCALFWNGLKSDGDQFHFPWLSDIAVNLAYGRAEEDGIHFRKWFRHRFVTWRAIGRLEYWPEVDGRITLHLYSQRSPIVFIPEIQRPDAGVQHDSGLTTVGFISRKLNETWPGKSTFAISYESPKTKTLGFFAKMLSGHTVRQKALANTLGMLLTLFLFYVYLAIRNGYGRYYWKAIVVLWMLGLTMWLCERISKSRRVRATPSDDKLKPPNSGLTKS